MQTTELPVVDPIAELAELPGHMGVGKDVAYDDAACRFGSITDTEGNQHCIPTYVETLHIELHAAAAKEEEMNEVMNELSDALGDMDAAVDAVTATGRALNAHLGAYETKSNWIFVEGPDEKDTHWEVTNYLQLSEEDIIEYLNGGGVWGGTKVEATEVPAAEATDAPDATDAPARNLMEHGPKITVGEIAIAEEFTAAKAKAEDLALPVATIDYAQVGTVDENKIADGASNPAATEAPTGDDTAAPETTPGTTTAAKSFSKAKAITGAILALLGLAQF